MIKAIRFLYIFTLVGIISLGIIWVLMWMQMITTQTERVGSDFMGLYSAARISQDQGFYYIYDIESQQNIQEQVVGFRFYPDQTSYFTHPPFIVLLVRLITDDDYVHSLIRWTVILLLLNGLNVFILMRTLVLTGFQARERWVLALGTFLFWPTFSGLMNGQDVAILLLGTAIWMLQLLNEKQVMAGLGLCLATIRPQLALMLSVPFLIRHQKVLLGFILGSMILTLLSLGLIGSTGFFDYLNILHVVESGMWYLPHTKDMPTISGLLRRNFEIIDKDFFRYAVWSGFLAGLTGVILWWRKNHKITEQHIGLLILAGLIFIPYAHYHELALLLIPMFCLIRMFLAKNLVSSQNLALLPLATSFLLMVGFIGTGILKFFAVYSVMFLLGYFLLFPEKITRLQAVVTGQT
jgi:hypothetical protein